MGNVTIKTTAGDVTIHCKATALELGGTPLYNEEFEEDYTDWTFVDADEDGMCWVTAASQTEPRDLHRGYQSSECIVSVGWDIKRQQSHTPDNWAITPAVTLPGEGDSRLVFFYSVRGNETFDVMVGHGADLSSYESVASISDTSYLNDPDNNWNEKEVDLSAYAGQTVNIAFRHYISQYWVSIDGVLVYNVGGLDAIQTVAADHADATVYDLQGRPMGNRSARGISIVRTADASGNVTVRKTAVK